MNHKERQQVYSQKLTPEYEKYLAKIRKSEVRKKRPVFSAKGKSE